MTVFNFTVKDMLMNDVTLDEYKGKVLLIINSATECGFTPQYSELQKLYRRYSGRDFTILDFPCDQFGHQAPGTNEEIAKFCTDRFSITFPLFSKIEVNGDNADPLFTYLKSQKSFAGFDPAHPLTKTLDDMLSAANPDYKNSSEIMWNFTKFLVDKGGNVVRRFEPTAGFEEIEEAVVKLL